MIKFTLIPLLLLLIGGCATNPVTGKPNVVLMSESQEVDLGKKTHADVLKQYAVYDNPEIQALVEQLGRDLAASSHRSHLDFTFTVLDSPQVNAFATPGGYIYITRGIMAYMNNEEQLAGVLGHEIGHVTARHSVRQHSAQTASSLVSVIAAIATGNNQVGQMTSQFGQAFVRGYGRNHELEADRLGAEYLAEIGYDPEMMLGVVGILKDQEEFEKKRAKKEGREPQAYHGVFSTHPRNDQRLQEVVRAAEKFKNPNARRSDPETFLRLMDGVTFGNSEDQGILMNNNFYHKSLDLAMDFPKDWKVDNQPTQLVALNKAQNAALIVQLGKPGEANTPQQFLNNNFKNLRGGKDVGEDGYTAITDGKTPFSQGKVPVRVAALFHQDNVLVVSGFARGGLPESGFFDLVESIRGLTKDEQELASARKITIVRARSGDTISSLAARSNIDRDAEDQIRLLNGLFPDGEPDAGQLVKIIK